MAARTGQAVAAVLDAPYAITLWTFVQLQDADRLTRLLEKKARLDLARYIAFAMWQPKELSRIEREEFQGLTAAAPDGLATREGELIELARAIDAARRQRLTEAADGPP